MTIARTYVPNKALKKKGCCLGTKSPAANKVAIQKSPVQKSFQSFLLRKSKGNNRSKKKKGSQENAVGKNAKGGTVRNL